MLNQASVSVLTLVLVPDRSIQHLVTSPASAMSLLAGQQQPPDPGAETAGLSAFKAVGSQLAVSAGQSISMFSMSATNNCCR